MKKFLITGANGQVGSELQALCAGNEQIELLLTDVAELDITSLSAVRDFFNEQSIDYCINCAAYTAVDKAESNAELAALVNETGARNLATACAENGSGMIHISTDYVYHNHLNRPLLETDPTEPKSVYARTKLAGDLAVLDALPGAAVIRTSWVYSSFGHNFVKTMLRLGQERDRLTIVADQIGTPTYARDLAAAILYIIDQKANGAKHSGIFHYSNEGICSWYDFAHAIFDIRGIQCAVAPIPTSAYPTPASRPPFSVLDKSRIKTTFDLTIPHWRDSLEHCLNLLNA